MPTTQQQATKKRRGFAIVLIKNRPRKQHAHLPTALPPHRNNLLHDRQTLQTRSLPNALRPSIKSASFQRTEKMALFIPIEDHCIIEVYAVDVAAGDAFAERWVVDAAKWILQRCGVGIRKKWDGDKEGRLMRKELTSRLASQKRCETRYVSNLEILHQAMTTGGKTTSTSPYIEEFHAHYAQSNV